jgi:hypothetical protein
LDKEKGICGVCHTEHSDRYANPDTARKDFELPIPTKDGVFRNPRTASPVPIEIRLRISK